MRISTYASVVVASSLVVLKLLAWLLSDSVAILSSLIDSGLDTLASVVTLVAVSHALVPADREHRFGHGKAEAIAALGQAAFIAGSALFLIFESGNRLMRPQLIEYGQLAISVMGVSILLTLGLVFFQNYVVARTQSMAIGADSAHYKADLFVNCGIITSLILTTQLNVPIADPLIALAVALYILYTARKIGITALDALMDHELSEDDRERIAKIVRTHAEVRGLHDLRTRMAGTQPFIQLHLELPGDITLDDAHIISDQVEEQLLQEFPDAEVIIHQDPEGLNEVNDNF
ncbi:MAG: divalent metal cation transporter FieF [Rhodospirillaceae bacterium]|nr:divalent metal cation transporter FieF [Rhodospirillaceae bacterium]